MNALNNDSKPSEPTSPESTRKKQLPSPKSFILAMGLFIFFVGVGFGFIFGVSQSSSAEQKGLNMLLHRSEDHTSEEVDFNLFWQVWDYVDEHYVDQPVDQQQMLYGAIDGLLAGVGDPYAAFFDPEESKEFFEEINGNFEGIGAEIGFRQKQLTVISPIVSSPAEKAGLRPGDRIVGINGEDTSTMSLYTAVDKIRGEKGSEVTLTLFREGEKEPFDVKITRDIIHIESVKWEMMEVEEKRIALLTITHFNGDTTEQFNNAVNEIVLKQPDGLVVDVRNNPGGFLTSVIEIASSFIPEGKVVVWRHGQEDVDEAYMTEGSAPLAPLDTIVLMNAGSASAAEILAAALQENGQAKLIGTTTFGKGTVQDVYNFDNGSTLKLTIARWLTPNKNLIEEHGVDPDYFVDRTEEDIDADRDPQMKAAKMYFSDPEAFKNEYKEYVPETPETTLEEQTQEKK